MNIEELKNAYNQYCKIYREEHKEKIKLSMKKWYQQNKDDPEYIEKRKASSKRYYETQRDLEGKSKRTPSKLSPSRPIAVLHCLQIQPLKVPFTGSWSKQRLSFLLVGCCWFGFGFAYFMG